MRRTGLDVADVCDELLMDGGINGYENAVEAVLERHGDAERELICRELSDRASSLYERYAELGKLMADLESVASALAPSPDAVAAAEATR